ncbi:hypothetical protein SCH01S_28_00550 [Sphingomonas changbaiensis NBRC 104936]|uniref:Putative zinc-finger domain-containing protein n=1 Tax=Sphingomonas changbaiensis NBRC 104936 TaxID=1219043 RepID=A0A0E9MP35_9SPHN|nr:anti-sigma factor [Sphingomonas changbaiensis]GAO39196.1 hypothetical protein SCH01S_28_00550 [Sphingomonas changbaiensis NBRC 104936]
MTACIDREMAVQSLADGELDSMNALELEAHLQDCPGCAATLARLRAVRAKLVNAEPRYRAPEALRARIEAMIGPEAEGEPARPARTLPWFGGGAIGALAASMALLFAAPQLTSTALQDQLIAGHIRSLQASHLVDVATSDRHVVKPWFNGRVDFAPPVAELAPQGFPLVGGRLDYLDGRPVAALVYRRRLHSINLFVRPAPALASPVAATTHRDGYSLTRWVAGGLEYWAVSDIDSGDLQAFRTAFRKASGT